LGQLSSERVHLTMHPARGAATVAGRYALTVQVTAAGDPLPIGVREVLGMDIGLTEDVVVWRKFVHGLVARGIGGLTLVISDTHAGLKQDRRVFLGAG
jgi:hypothetical protein